MAFEQGDFNDLLKPGLAEAISPGISEVLKRRKAEGELARDLMRCLREELLEAQLVADKVQIEPTTYFTLLGLLVYMSHLENEESDE